MTLVYAHLSASVDGYVSGRGARAGLGLGDGFRIFDWLSDDSAPRTANGLRKRTPRAQRGGAARKTEAAAPSIEKSNLINDSPESVRDRLNALRGGIQRGNAETAGLS